MFFIFFLLFSSIVESVRPPKSYCTPHVSLIKYVTDSPDGKPFCSSLNSDPKTVTDVGIVTATETVTTTASKTVTLVTRSGVTQTNFTTWTTTDLVYACPCAVKDGGR